MTCNCIYVQHKNRCYCPQCSKPIDRTPQPKQVKFKVECGPRPRPRAVCIPSAGINLPFSGGYITSEQLKHKDVQQAIAKGHR